MTSVKFLASVGGDGSTVSDDGNAATGLDNGGHRTRFVPALAQVVAIASNVVAMALASLGYANNAAASAASALGAPGTNASSNTNLTVGLGAINFVIQTGKLYVPGQTVVLASTADAGNQMVGYITAYNSGSGAMAVTVTYVSGNGTFNSWVLALAALSAAGTVPTNRTITGGGLATGGGSLAADRTITVPKAVAADVLTGTDDSKALTIKSLVDASASVALADAATITPDLATGINFALTLGGNRTLAAPANLKAGQSGVIVVSQDGTGNRSLSFASIYKFSLGVPTLSTGANAVDVISYYVHTPTLILCTISQAFG